MATGNSWDLWDLKDAAESLEDGMKTLLPGTSTCQQCHRPKALLEAATFDAGQAFEIVSPVDVVRGLYQAFEDLRVLYGQTSVSVAKSQKLFFP